MSSDATFRTAMEAYLAGLAESPVRTLSELIEKNKEMKDKELPPGMQDNPLVHSVLILVGRDSQAILEKDVDFQMTTEEYDETMKFVRQVSRDEGIDHILKKYGCDVIIGPADSPMTYLAASSGTLLALRNIN